MAGVVRVYGLLRGACRRLPPDGRGEWRAHQCAVCSALGNEFGLLARIATHWDAALLSVLWEAQLPQQAEPERVTVRCPVPPFRQRAVPDPAGPGRRFAGSIAILTAWAKAEDWLADADVRWIRFPGVARWARRRADRAQQQLNELGFDARPHTEAILHHTAVERSTRSLDDRCAPVEGAYAAAFAHTSQLSEAQGNLASLGEMGRAYGRLTYLADAAQDVESDRRHGRANLLLDCLGREEVERALPFVAGQARQRLREAFAQLEVSRHAELLQRLLIDRAPYRVRPRDRRPSRPEATARRDTRRRWWQRRGDGRSDQECGLDCIDVCCLCECLGSCCCDEACCALACCPWLS